MSAPIRITVNGTAREVDAPGDVPLLWILREELGLTGTKFGCGVGLCGACTVHLDGRAARACTVTLGSVGSARVTTIEGLAADASHPVQRAWLAEQVPQCGYCQPGMIMAAAALLAEDPSPSDAKVAEAITNLCRCGTYPRVRLAIRRAARESRGG
jgi:isoquinoline 1-oxidoreductase alpha subunit